MTIYFLGESLGKIDSILECKVPDDEYNPDSIYALEVKAGSMSKFLKNGLPIGRVSIRAERQKDEYLQIRIKEKNHLEPYYGKILKIKSVNDALNRIPSLVAYVPEKT